ncbi:TPA: hypothetical protein ACH3X2_005839 [Trebouxia sp. C0005]|nr:MAG: peptidyl-prolyl cis-trans FKBP-type [Trebouxia sp. A1-2]
MAHVMSCKSLHSYRSWRKVHAQPLGKSCRKLPVCCTGKQHHDHPRFFGAGETQKPVLSNKSTRRALLQASPALLGLQMLLPEEPAEAVGFKKDLQRRRGFKAQIPEEDFQAGPQGLKYVEMTPGKGALPKKGDRIAVHYEIRWHGVTFMTSRQGMGVTGGEPLGFNLGAQGPGGTLPGLDLTVQAGEGMRVGGSRKAILPPELGYGEKGIGEIPGGATLELDVELLSVKTSPFGSRVKIVEG